MWTLTLWLVLIGLCLQVNTGSSPCPLHGLIANCAAKRLYWVPVLPANIIALYLEFNYISDINSTSLSLYDQLQELDLGRQRVSIVIRNDAFLSQRKLVKLVLGYNVGLKLEPRAFAGLVRLQYLFLDYSTLNNSILADSYLEPLISLELLDLFGNQITLLRPGLFFTGLSKLSVLNLKLNQIERLCEEDLVGFRGKRFANMNLESNRIARMYDTSLEGCGNPFKEMAFDFLDMSTNGFNVNKTARFFEVINGTPITHLKFSGHMGKGFSHDNFPDPDKSTFESLQNSSVDYLDLSGNFIFDLKEAVFSPLKVARIIDVSKNKINQIKKKAFYGLQGSLQMLNLSSNLLGEIYSHTFADLTQLIILDLSYNHIGALGYKAFSDLPNLSWLFLSGNSLRDLGFPATLPNLEILLLDDNKLNSLSSITDIGVSSTFVDLRNNRLTNMEDVYIMMTYFRRLQKLFYSGNFIKWCSLTENSLIPYNNSLQLLILKDSSLEVIWGQGNCLDLFDNMTNLLALDMSLNSLTSLPPGIFKGLVSILEMDLSSNSLTSLQRDVFPASLEQLDLSNNFIAFPDPVTFKSLVSLQLAGNRFHCDCNLESFLLWLNATSVVTSPPETHRCEFPAALHDLPLLNYTTVVEPCEVDDEMSVQELKLALFVLSALLITAFTLGGIVYARLRGRIFVIYKKLVSRVVEGPKVAPPLEEVQYDAFLCFSNSDYMWVEAALLKKLDNNFSEENIFRCCFEARDFLPGEDHLSNIRNAVWGSRKTLCVVSKEFLKDGWCVEAFTVAQSRMLEELTDILILLVVGKVTQYQLMKYNAIRDLIQKRDYLVWPQDPQDLGWFYERLETKLLKNTKTNKLAEDRAPPVQEQNQPQDNVQLEELREVRL